MSLFRAAAVGVSLWLMPADAVACRLALALGLDVSASVDAAEYRLQVDGLARALSTPPVRPILLAQPGAPVALAVYEWSGPADQRVLVDWRLIDGETALDDLVVTLRAVVRVPMDDNTALGAAMLFGGALLERSPRCARWVLDLSGDGPSNTGVAPQAVGADALPGVTINALVIGADRFDSTDRREANIAELSRYFATHVIRGPGAFVQVALGFEDYARAMAEKLVREIGAQTVAAR